MTDDWLQQQESSRIWHFFRFDFFNFIMSPPHLLDSKIFLFYTHKTQSTAAFGNDDNLKPFNGGSIAVIRTRRDQINWSSWHNGGMIFNISQLVLTFPFSLKKKKKRFFCIITRPKFHSYWLYSPNDSNRKSIQSFT